MAALRVAVGLLMVPCLASPAAAEISTSDLTGTWLVRGLVAGASVDSNAAFATGSSIRPAARTWA